MARRPMVEIAQASLRVPRGHQGFWQVICELDQEGPWTIRMVDDRCNVDRASIKDYVLRLYRAGLAALVGDLPQSGTGTVPQNQYRLTKRPLQAPRLDRDGKELGEQQRETIWRAMKMLGEFDAAEISRTTETVTRQRAYKYLLALHGAGVIVQVGEGPLRSGRFRIRQNVGALAPVVTKAEVVFDPNSRTVLGQPQLVEAQP